MHRKLSKSAPEAHKVNDLTPLSWTKLDSTRWPLIAPRFWKPLEKELWSGRIMSPSEIRVHEAQVKAPHVDSCTLHDNGVGGRLCSGWYKVLKIHEIFLEFKMANFIKYCCTFILIQIKENYNEICCFISPPPNMLDSTWMPHLKWTWIRKTRSGRKSVEQWRDLNLVMCPHRTGCEMLSPWKNKKAPGDLMPTWRSVIF